MKRLCLVIVVIMLLLAGGCSRECPCVPVDERPTACFSARVEPLIPVLLPQRLVLVLDASCSSDDNTERDSLKVRWDFGNDGVWDTGYRSVLEQEWYYDLPVCGPRFWTVRCEVVDRQGQRSRSEASVDLGPRPIAPDIIANCATIVRDADGVETDSIGVGQSFTANLWLFACGYSGTYALTMRCLLDGTILLETHSSTGLGMSCIGQGGMVVNTPGDYTLTVIVDPDNTIPESDYTNNSASTRLVILR